jgi:hypothetical protein
MNTKAALFSALIATGLLVLLTRQRDTAAGAAAPAKIIGAVTAPTPLASVSDNTGTASEPKRNAVVRSHAPSEPFANDEHHRLDIPPELLRDARKAAEESAARIADNEAALNDARYYNQSLNAGNPARKLALRLELDAEAAQKIEAVLAGALADQIKARMETERAELEREARLLTEDREGYVTYLALQAMLSRGVALSTEQQSFHNRFELALGRDAASAASSDSSKWFEDVKIVDAMNRQLSPAKQAELAAYITDQQHRDQEARAMHAQMRANQIAEQLGLGKAEQSTLLEYLKENPGAPNAEISALLPSELKGLLPAGM